MTLIGQLRAWQFREWLYSAAVAVAAIALVAFVGISIACAIDYVWEWYYGTPFYIRAIMTVLQLAVYLGLAFLLFLFIRSRIPTIDALAGRAEKRVPLFDHRLVTSLQLNRPGAKIKGMSEELIRSVTVEAEEMARQHKLPSFAIKTRLKLAAVAILGLSLIIGGIFALSSIYGNGIVEKLILRQCLLPVEIPKLVRTENASVEKCAAGDPIELKFRVHGPVSERTTGSIVVMAKSQPDARYTATYLERDAEGAAIFKADVLAMTEDFEFKARFRDGRMNPFGKMRVVPRPVVAKVTAWVLLPKYVDPEGKRRYEKVAAEGEIVAHSDSSVRVQGSFSKPISKGTVTVYGRDEKGIEKVLKVHEMLPDEDGRKAEVTFDMPAKPTAYSIEVIDLDGFNNLSPPRRGITVMTDAPPRVELLDEVMKGGPGLLDPKTGKPIFDGPNDDYEVRGMPIKTDGQVLIGYRARSPLGLSKAFIVYRVNDGDWSALPLAKVDADESLVGPFVPSLGIFAKYDEFQTVEFYQLPSTDPETEPPGLVAGGRYNFQTAALVKVNKETGKRSKLELGDRVEFYVAVYDRKPGVEQPPNDKAASGRPPGVSESRIKSVVTQSQFQEWDAQRLQSQDRLKRLEEIQRGVFGQKAPPKK